MSIFNLTGIPLKTRGEKRTQITIHENMNCLYIAFLDRVGLIFIRFDSRFGENQLVDVNLSCSYIQGLVWFCFQ